MGVGAGVCMYDVFVKTFMFAVSSPVAFLFFSNAQLELRGQYSLFMA